MNLLLVPLLVLVGLSLHDLARRPTLRRLAFRNATRRKGEAVLVMVGSLLGTAIITSALIVGDTLGSSIRDLARTRLGPVDEIVRVQELDRLDDVERAVTGSPLPGTDGVLRAVTAGATAATTGDDRRAEPGAFLVEMDFDAARRFGADPAATGLAGAGPTPSPGEAVIGEDLAEELDIEPGARFDVYAYGARLTLAVRDVVPRLGLAGLAVVEGGTSPNVFVTPGTIAGLAAADATEVAAQPAGLVLVSNEGGVFEGVDGTDAVVRDLEERLAGVPGVEVDDVKRDTLATADDEAASFTELFGGIGAFSVIAGVLLLVNVFVMLAEERKTELGMLRAVGMKRNLIVRAFGIEGGLYAVVSAALGALFGIAVGRVVVIVAQSVFNQGDDRFRLTLRFTAEPESLVTGALAGAVISLVTVWSLSARIGRLNVIRAIRDLPAPTLVRQRPRTVVLSAAGVLAGGLLLAQGVSSRSWFGALAGPAIAAFSAVPLLSRLLPRRLVVTVAGVVAAVWATLAFTLLPDVFASVEIFAFVVQGVILVAAAVTVLASNAVALSRLARPLLGGRSALAARLGLAYPVARRFRTSMLLGMYAIVIFTLTFLAVFSELFGAQAPRFTDETRAGYDISLDSNPANPVTVEQLEAQPEVAAAAPLLRAFPEWTHAAHPERERWPIAGFDRQLLELGVPTLGTRDARYGSDREAWEAVLATPDLAILPDFFLQGGGPPESRLEPGDRVAVYAAGERRELTVAALTSSDWLFNGVMVGAPFARSFIGPEAVASRHFVKVREGLDPDAVADELTGRLLEHGVDAEAIAAIVAAGLQQQEGFLTLMQGYLALGLLIGIAGLGVVMVRAVRERRREIGMLRAMGFPSRTVRSAFLLESLFVAVQGVVIGVALALVVSYQVLVNSSTFGESRLDFLVPWEALAVLMVATLGASLVAILAPAGQASRIKPAVALRIAD